MKRLEEKIAVVTGSAQGIGAGISRILAKHGAVVCLADIQESVEATTESICKDGGKAFAYKIDVTKSESVEATFAKIVIALSLLRLVIVSGVGFSLIVTTFFNWTSSFRLFHTHRRSMSSVSVLCEGISLTLTS